MLLEVNILHVMSQLFSIETDSFLYSAKIEISGEDPLLFYLFIHYPGIDLLQ